VLPLERWPGIDGTRILDHGFASRGGIDGVRAGALANLHSHPIDSGAASHAASRRKQVHAGGEHHGILVHGQPPIPEWAVRLTG